MCVCVKERVERKRRSKMKKNMCMEKMNNRVREQQLLTSIRSKRLTAGMDEMVITSCSLTLDVLVC